jgi:DNA polymerase III delta prime subunit
MLYIKFKKGKSMTVQDSILKILNSNINVLFTANEITNLIIENNIYDFSKAKHPEKVVGSQLSKMLNNNLFSLQVNKENKAYLYFLQK